MNPDQKDPKKVFVVHGRNEPARRALFDFLRAIKLDPIEWTQLIRLTGKPADFIGNTLEIAFAHVQAVVVLLTGDDLAKLRDELLTNGDREHERILTPQARPNVLFEAGMAFGSHANNTALVELGEVRPFSDVAGRQVVKMNNTIQKRQELAQRLQAAGCPVDTTGTDWHTAGDFDKAILQLDASSIQVQRPPKSVSAKELEILQVAWEKLQIALGLVSAITSPAKSYPDLSRMHDDRLKEWLDHSVLTESEREVLLQSTDKNAYYQETLFWHDVSKANTEANDFHNYIIVNKIFLSSDVHKLFSQLDRLLNSALFQCRMAKQSDDLELAMKAYETVSKKVTPILEQIEALVRKRLHNQEA